ncbi:MAG: hypothetical protein CMP59_06655 [Flavobacteriales bacterium]|nr:hypothetical protein [Flavobacteriales bacterium]|tara:strand:- start:259 stop:774 length:516 start_codon:yes stop_codon:yes gene_type:complete
MQVQKQTSKEYLRGLSIVHAALLFGQIIFLALMLFINSTQIVDNSLEDLNEIFLILVPLVAIAGILGGKFLTQNKLESIKAKSDLNEKLDLYRGALIVKLALLEGPSFFGIICYYLTGDYIYAGIAALIIIIFFTYRPTKESIVKDLELDREEKSLLDNPEAIVTEVKVRR